MMTFNNQTKTLLVVAVVLVAVYFFYKNYSTNKMDRVDENNLPENFEEHLNVSEEARHDNVSEQSGVQSDMPNEDMKYFSNKDYTPPESDWLKSKFQGRNTVQNGFKRVSYSGDRRGSLGPSDWTQYFDHNNDVIGNSQTGENDKFLPVDESTGSFAVFKSTGRATCGSNQNCEPEDLFDVDKYLPQEVNDDWFEVQPEPISVKNRHLINITKPIGINTIGSSLKNSSYDIRGSPACPKFVVAPWLQSSIEPDVNLKPLY